MNMTPLLEELHFLARQWGVEEITHFMPAFPWFISFTWSRIPTFIVIGMNVGRDKLFGDRLIPLGIEPEDVVIWTLAHEVGHYRLNHFFPPYEGCIKYENEIDAWWSALSDLPHLKSRFSSGVKLAEFALRIYDSDLASKIPTEELKRLRGRWVDQMV